MSAPGVWLTDIGATSDFRRQHGPPEYPQIRNKSKSPNSPVRNGNDPRTTRAYLIERLFENRRNEIQQAFAVYKVTLDMNTNSIHGLWLGELRVRVSGFGSSWVFSVAGTKFTWSVRCNGFSSRRTDHHWCSVRTVSQCKNKKTITEFSIFIDEM